MTCLRKIFRHYPVRRLPADLQNGFSFDAFVTITIETETITSGIVIKEELYEFRDEQVVLVTERSYTAP